MFVSGCMRPKALNLQIPIANIQTSLKSQAPVQTARLSALFPHSSFFRHLAFVIRHSLPCLLLGASCFLPAHAATNPPDAAFRHPGVLLNQAQLDLIKSRVAAGKEPQKSAFEAVKTSPLGALSYIPKPWATCECGPRSNPDRGCKDEQRDSEAAYTQALLWYITGDKTYADNAIKIMNAWSSTLTGGHKLANGPVQAAWCAEVWPRAGEIIRYSNAGWPAEDIARFEKFL